MDPRLDSKIDFPGSNVGQNQRLSDAQRASTTNKKDNALNDKTKRVASRAFNELVVRIIGKLNLAINHLGRGKAYVVTEIKSKVNHLRSKIPEFSSTKDSFHQFKDEVIEICRSILKNGGRKEDVKAVQKEFELQDWAHITSARREFEAMESEVPEQFTEDVANSITNERGVPEEKKSQETERSEVQTKALTKKSEAQIEKFEAQIEELEKEIQHLKGGNEDKLQQLKSSKENFGILQRSLQDFASKHRILLNEQEKLTKGNALKHQELEASQSHFKKAEEQLTAVQEKLDRAQQRLQKIQIQQELKELPKKTIKKADEKFPKIVVAHKKMQLKQAKELKEIKEAQIRIPAEALGKEVREVIDLSYGYEGFEKSLGRKGFFGHASASADNKRLKELKSSDKYALETTVSSVLINDLVAEAKEVVRLVTKGFEHVQQTNFQVPKEIKERLEGILNLSETLKEPQRGGGKVSLPEGFKLPQNGKAKYEKIENMTNRRNQFNKENPATKREKAVFEELEKPLTKKKFKEAEMSRFYERESDDIEIDETFNPKAIRQERLRENITEKLSTLIDSIYIKAHGFKHSLGQVWGTYSKENKRIREIQAQLNKEIQSLDSREIQNFVDEVIELIEKGYIQLDETIPQNFKKLMSDLEVLCKSLKGTSPAVTEETAEEAQGVEAQRLHSKNSETKKTEKQLIIDLYSTLDDLISDSKLSGLEESLGKNLSWLSSDNLKLSKAMGSLEKLVKQLKIKKRVPVEDQQRDLALSYAKNIFELVEKGLVQLGQGTRDEETKTFGMPKDPVLIPKAYNKAVANYNKLFMMKNS